MKLIEFVFKSDEYYKIALFDLNDISSIEQNDKTTCVLIMKDGRKYVLPGTHRGLTNRFVYGFGKVIEPHQDSILRPSILFYHRPEQAEEDKIFFDTYQFHAFKSAMEMSL
jgi:hypothetical protein